MAMRVSRDEVVTLIGYDAFQAIVAAHGGRELRIPVALERAPHLTQMVGHEQAQRMIEEFGGCSLDVPNGKRTPSTAPRVLHLRHQYNMSHSEIAATLDCTERAVRKILASLKTGMVPGLPSPADD